MNHQETNPDAYLAAKLSNNVRRHFLSDLFTSLSRRPPLVIYCDVLSQVLLTQKDFEKPKTVLKLLIGRPIIWIAKLGMTVVNNEATNIESIILFSVSA